MMDQPMPDEMRREIEKIEAPKVLESDIGKHVPEIDGTKIILQRHENYVRELGEDASETLGSLTKETAKKAYQQSRAITEELLAPLGDDLSDVDFLVVGSNTKYQDQGQRSIETAQQALQAVRDVMEEKGIDKNQLLNNRSKSQDVAPIARMRVDRIFNECLSTQHF